MKLFVYKILLFSIPLLAYLALALFIDPYNIIHKENNARLAELKSMISYRLNYPLYDLQQFSESPTDIVLLGDSRTAKLKSSTIESLTQMGTTNLAYGGGRLPEIIETFWYITNIHAVKQVYIGINFNLYNYYMNRNRVPEAIELKNSPFSYLLSKYCFKSLYLILKSCITNKVDNPERPKETKNEFWEYQLEYFPPFFYRDYRYPASYLQGLKKIADYCKSEGIRLVFFIPPTHLDLQQKVYDFKLEQEQNRFKSDLATIGTLYDFDYPNEITQDKDNFLDPFHFNDLIADIVAREIVTGNLKYARQNNIYTK